MESLVVIGMRGAGKSTLGRVSAACLGWKFIDMDEFLESEQGKSCGELIESLGWEGFRKVEKDALEKVLKEHPQNTVISCGGGIVETQPARDLLKQHAGPVLHIRRAIEDIIAYLESKETQNQAQASDAESLARRPKYGESILAVWERRLPWFLECSTHCFEVSKGDKLSDRVIRDVETFVLSLYVTPTPDLLVPNVWILAGKLEDETVGKVCPDALYIESISAETLVDARGHWSLPLVVDVGHSSELLLTALERCVPYIVTSDPSAAESIPAGMWRGTSKLILRYPFGGLSQVLSTSDSFSASRVQAGVQQVVSDLSSILGPFSGLLVPGSAFPDSLSGPELVQVLSLLHAGFSDKVSLLLEPSVAASGSAAWDLAQAFFSSAVGPLVTSQIPKAACVISPQIGAPLIEHHCLFGHPIQLSPSPAMHNAGFTALSLPRKYTLCDTLDVNRVGAVIKSHRFRGASVTIPHKEVVHQFLDKLSDAAETIGAVNTIIKTEQGELVGDNTDWFGIYNLLAAPIASRGSQDGVGLVIGAGGTALAAGYCIKQLGLRLVVYNRTLEKAQRVADRMGGTAITDLSALESVDAIIGTVPATAEFQMPDEEILHRCKPIVFDAAYRPRRTKLLLQAASCGCVTFEGIDMLVEQGLKQMELWTGKPAPRKAMDAAARKFYDETDPAKKSVA